ncbi:mycofactocin biosynthesis glycosyltransferase MftF [Nocardioides pocheonensis]|uniref:Mycofactocin system glycosyltransferase n=1 Tax=Nocardioides pocheonensis TaxID=661485 RepID=A0A3N0GIX3_9ACTN|nr:mycofactocin biosynthesis glycosyltransferase MftF [Nocardioides pocheonensis]RNM12156.1 mycofactocin system glycosyltransferase [Nocardioides pocheonensis]
MSALPAGFTVRLASDVLVADGGRLLVGGSPLTAMRLSAQAHQMLVDNTICVTDEQTAHVAQRLLATNLGVPDLANVAEADADALTVVIPVRDRPAQLDRALGALTPLRSVVVDDASLDRSAVAAIAARHGARLLPLEANVGPAAARNAGAALVTTPFIAFVDSDVEVDATTLLMLTRHFADPQVCLVGPRITGVVRSERPRWFERYDVVASSLTLGEKSASVAPGSDVGWLPSACLVGRTSIVAGAFDESLRVGEDVDLVWRLVAQGHRVRYDPTIEAGHDTRTTLWSWLGRKAFYGSGSAKLAERHGDALAPAVLTPTFAAAAAALLLRNRWSGPSAAVGLAVGMRAVQKALPPTPDRRRVAGRLALRGLCWAVRQEASLLLRHWWPVAACGALASRNLRRAMATAVVVDSFVGLAEHRERTEHVSPFLLALGRRLDDAAYGTGLWWGAARAGSPTSLLPRRPHHLKRQAASLPHLPTVFRRGSNARGNCGARSPRGRESTRDPQGAGRPGDGPASI